MPHITSFFRSSHDPINTIKATVRRRSPSSRTPVSATPRPGSTRTVSYPNSINDEAEDQENQQTRSNNQSVAPPVRMPESAREKEASHHRLSFPGLHLGGHKSKDHGEKHPHASLDWKIESPPAVMYGDAENSTGAIVSGQLMLTAKDAPLEVEGFKARLEIHVIRKRPYKDHCHDCTNQKTELKTWELIAGPATLSQGELHSCREYIVYETNC
jgi:arrestin-related trafficking adapter 1